MKVHEQIIHCEVLAQTRWISAASVFRHLLLQTALRCWSDTWQMPLYSHYVLCAPIPPVHGFHLRNQSAYRSSGLQCQVPDAVTHSVKLIRPAHLPGHCLNPLHPAGIPVIPKVHAETSFFRWMNRFLLWRAHFKQVVHLSKEFLFCHSI